MSVRIVSSSNESQLPVVGRTIRAAARSLREVFNIHPDASAYVNGQIVDDAYVLRDGDCLEFVRTLGQKGGLQEYWSEDEVIELFGEETFEAMRGAGLAFTPQPVLDAEGVAAWTRWLANNDYHPQQTIPVVVNEDTETIIVRGKAFHLERQLGLIVKCLIQARGEIRSTAEIKKTFPGEPWDDRLDLTIQRKLIRHVSGIGKFVETVSKKGYRIHAATS